MTPTVMAALWSDMWYGELWWWFRSFAFGFTGFVRLRLR
jgi:hypothetical protein